MARNLVRFDPFAELSSDKGVLKVDGPFAALPAPTKVPITAGPKA